MTDWVPLARRMRPRRFDQMVGQPVVSRILSNAIRERRVPVSLVLAGPAGTGKTTVARLLAAGLNCRGAGEHPCGVCDSCDQVAAGRHPYLEEIDAGSDRGIDDMDRIRQVAQLAMPGGCHRIFILDEAHQLTARAWTSLLKLVEEPPPLTSFVFATTDGSAIIKTIASRSMRLTLGPVSNHDMLWYLEQIAQYLGVKVDQSIADCIVREAKGSVRDALHLLDAALLTDDPNAFVEAFGTPREAIELLADALLDRNAHAFVVALDKLTRSGIQPSEIARTFLLIARDFWLVASGWVGETMSGLPALGIKMNLGDDATRFRLDALFRAAAQLVERRRVDRIDIEVAYFRYLTGTT